MEFNSLSFLIFFPCTLILYFLIPRQGRRFWLLISSYIFYMGWEPRYAVLIFFSTLTTYLCGRMLEAHRGQEMLRRLSIASCIGINLLILAVFKYGNMIIDLVQSLGGLMHWQLSVPHFSFLLPVGISFYTFQAIGYIIDVYRGDPAEKSFVNYALFVSFFPQLVAGPIERARNILGQIRQIEQFDLWNLDRVTRGAVRMLWGYFLKLIIADRAAMMANAVFDGYASLGSLQLIAGVLAFTFQIYCDFAAYSEIAIGASQIMGIRLMENFKMPYLSSSIRDFWDRWHISLSTWFGDYLYRPLGGNRRGFFRTELNKLIVFTVSGLWHGSSLHFMMWGFLNGLYQVVEDVCRRMRRTMQTPTGHSSGRLRLLAGRILVFVLIAFAWIFFRAASIRDAFAFIGCMFRGPLVGAGTAAAPAAGAAADLLPGITRLEFGILAAGLTVLALVDILREWKQTTIDYLLLSCPVYIRWPLIWAMFLAIFIFGVYGPSYDPQEFIYFQF